MVITNTADTNNDLKTLAVDYVYYLFSRAFIPFEEYFDTVNKIGKIENDNDEEIINVRDRLFETDTMKSCKTNKFMLL